MTSDIDSRIARIMEKMKGLSAKNPEYSCGEFPPKWEKPLTEGAVKEFESRNGIILPEDYGRFITTVAAGGTQPFYGLRSIFYKSGKKRDVDPDVKTQFHYTLKEPLDLTKLSEEEIDSVFETLHTDSGFIELCHEGCGMHSVLIVNSKDPETYGTVWYYDLANDVGIFPLIDPKRGKAMSFLDWLEYYVDKTLELDNDKFFSYGELARFGG
ncbi:MAG: SMI1/KNR4 family protein [Ruminiclostridium sp.]|nr:SMI1/KNR4 family protein [Ruminiclostridium sp.]